MNSHSLRDATSIGPFRSWLIDWVVRELAIERSTIDLGKSFLRCGMDSVQAMTMVGDLEVELELRLPPTLPWDYPDIATLSAYLFDRMTTMSDRTPEARQPKISTAVHKGPIKDLAVELDPLNDRQVDEVVRLSPDSG